MLDQQLDISDLVKMVYAPPRRLTGWKLDELVAHSNIHYFRLGRHALYSALKGIGVSKDDIVLLPTFICKELLSAVHELGATPKFYSVSRQLEINQSVDSLPPAKAILAVNFFGFPQNMTSFREYCEKVGAVLIEDNAHGLFGLDEKKCALGSRGDIGIFSPRKSLGLYEGAALTINEPSLIPYFNLQTTYAPPVYKLGQQLKRLVRASVPRFGIFPARSFIKLTRLIRKIRTGHEILPSPPESERYLPEDDRPQYNLVESFATIDFEKEIIRRKALYKWLDEYLREFSVEPVFRSLSENVVPYGYPMFLREEQIPEIKQRLESYGLECFRWPDLPMEVSQNAPSWYHQVWSVHFIW